MSKKMRFNTSGLWADYLVGDFLGRITEERARYRAEWIDSVIVSHLPSWKVKLVARFPKSKIVALLLPKIEIIHSKLIANFGVETVIKIRGKAVAQRKFAV